MASIGTQEISPKFCETMVRRERTWRGDVEIGEGREKRRGRNGRAQNHPKLPLRAAGSVMTSSRVGVIEV
jgi:hypothetical protein